MSATLTEMDVRQLQERLNRFREARKIPLRPIAVSGVLDKATEDAIRCCQHEHNSFFKTKELLESGTPDSLTLAAMEWWDRIISITSE